MSLFRHGSEGINFFFLGKIFSFLCKIFSFFPWTPVFQIWKILSEKALVHPMILSVILSLFSVTSACGDFLSSVWFCNFPINSPWWTCFSMSFWFPLFFWYSDNISQCVSQVSYVLWVKVLWCLSSLPFENFILYPLLPVLWKRLSICSLLIFSGSFVILQTSVFPLSVLCLFLFTVKRCWSAASCPLWKLLQQFLCVFCPPI